MCKVVTWLKLQTLNLTVIAEKGVEIVLPTLLDIRNPDSTNCNHNYYTMVISYCPVTIKVKVKITSFMIVTKILSKYCL